MGTLEDRFQYLDTVNQSISAGRGRGLPVALSLPDVRKDELHILLGDPLEIATYRGLAVRWDKRLSKDAVVVVVTVR